MLGEGNELVKHELLMQQKALYTAIKEQPTHRKLRSSKAKDLADVMVSEVCRLPFSDAFNANFPSWAISFARHQLRRMSMSPTAITLCKTCTSGVSALGSACVWRHPSGP
jgi:hypothetical protein